MKKILDKMLRNWKTLFCYSFIVLGLILLVIVLVKQPMKKTMTPLYNDESIQIEEVNFPIKKNININVDNLTGLWLYMDDDSLNNYNYEVELVDKKGNKYFYNVFENYSSNIIYMHLGIIKDSKNKELYLNINCDNCTNVNVAIDNQENLKIVEESYIKNNIYYWHIIMSISIGLVLLPLSKEDNNE